MADRIIITITLVLLFGGFVALYHILVKPICQWIKKLKDKNRKQAIAMKDFIVGLLEQMGCQPAVNKEGDICFKYQGENF